MPPPETQPDTEVRAPPAAEPRVVVDLSPLSLLRVVLAGVGVWLVWRLWNVILLTIMALLLYAAFNPLVRRLQRVLPRRAALATFIVIAALVVVSVGTLIVPLVFNQVIALLTHLPDYATYAQDLLARHNLHINLRAQVDHLGASGAEVVDLAQRILTSVTGAVSLVVLTVFLLIEGQAVGAGALRLLSRERRAGVRRLVAELGDQVGTYVRGQLLLSSLAGTSFLVLALALQIPEAWALGALAAVGDAVPVVGLLVVVFTGGLMALSISPNRALELVMLYLIYHQVELNILAPRIYGRAMGLTFTAVLISLLVGLELLGPLGAILALPVGAGIPCVIRWLQDWPDD